MKYVVLSVMLGLFAACAVGPTATNVTHRQTLPDGSTRTVSQSTNGFGVFSPSSGATMEEAGRADVSSAAAGLIDRTPAYYPYGWYYGAGAGVGMMSGTAYPFAQAGVPYGAFTASGMVIGQQLAQVVTPPAPMQIAIMQSHTPLPNSGGGGGGGGSRGGSSGGDSADDGASPSSTCVEADIVADYTDVRRNIQGILATDPISANDLGEAVKNADDVLADGEGACAGNTGALAAIARLRDEVNTFRTKLNEINVGK